MLLCNPRSLNNKVDELSLILDSNHIDIAAITETWFAADQPKDLFNIPGYDLFSRPRTDHKGASVAIYTKASLNATHLENISVPDDVEAMWINIRPPRLPRSIVNIVVGTVYYPPQSPIAQTLLEHISSAVDSIIAHQPDSGIAI